MKKRDKEYNALKNLGNIWEEYSSIDLKIKDCKTKKDKIICELEEIKNKTRKPAYSEKDLYKRHLMTHLCFLLGILFCSPLIIYFKTERISFFILGIFTIVIGGFFLAIAGGMTMENK